MVIRRAATVDLGQAVAVRIERVDGSALAGDGGTRQAAERVQGVRLGTVGSHLGGAVAGGVARTAVHFWVRYPTGLL